MSELATPGGAGALLLTAHLGLDGHTADVIWVVWLGLAVLSALYVAYDAFTQNPELTVMKWGWVIVTLYTGPVGAALYVLSCKEPAPGRHEEFVAPLWKQSLGSTIHCVAGDATGIIVASVVATSLHLPMWGDTIAEYVVGFSFGLLVFQAFFMRDMLGGNYLAAVRATFLAEWLSMSCVMAGMVPVLVIIRSRVTGARDVGSVRFWIVLSLGVFVSLVVAYPVNVWLVNNRLKHGMGTVRALGKGGEKLPATAAPGGDRDMSGMVMTSVAGAHSAVATAEAPAPSSTDAMAGMGMEASRVTQVQVVAVAVLTLVTLGVGLLLAAGFGSFTA